MNILIYTLAALFLCFEMGLQASPSVMTHQLMHDLHIDAAGLGLLAGVYFYSYTFMQIPAGLLFDRFSARHLMTINIIICLIGTLLFGLTDNLYIAATGRILIGFGSAFAFIGVLVIAANWFSAKYFAFLVGIAQLLAALGAWGGELPLAASVNSFGWRGTLYSLALFGAVLALLSFLFIRDRPSPRGQVLTLDKVESEPDKLVQSQDLAPPLTTLSILMRNPQTWAIALYAFFSWAPITAFAEFWGVPYLMELYHITNTQAAFYIGLIWLGIGIMSPLIGWLSDKMGRRCILLDLCALIGVIATVLMLYLPQLPLPLCLFLLFAFGFASAGQILSFAIVKDINREEVTGTAIGFNNMAVVAGGALFQPLIGFLLSFAWTGELINQTPYYSLASYQNALIVLPFCFFIAFIASRFLIRETYCQSSPSLQA